ncbi:glycosyltransferase family 4 protein [Natronorubrum sulfidifaciens]|uniref:Group 1 glycosyl transferase n=1 Tax=Natronorubrum sulfidifaciens JCM 14089 TaxID=1230460 RepID=L9W7Y4_9EURY|nr:glycosyltransferase family 4 protein [Natronorubrum sulfidifaciens]ELY45579.1 group 1 glycosyl transferase [Natronorubrum sulfidifaciens JCM 14089]
MQILLLTDWTYPCDHQFLSNVYADYLLRRGHKVTWVMRPGDESQQTIKRDVWNGSDVYILPSSAYNPARDAARFFAGRIQSNPLFNTGIDFADFDLVHVRNDLSMGLVASYLKKEFQIPYIHQISHLKAEELIETAHQGIEGPSSWVKGQLGKKLRRYVANSSDVVLPISKEMKQYLDHHSYSSSMSVLPTGASVVSNPPTGKHFKSEYDLKSEYILLYMGSMAPRRKLEFLFDMVDFIPSSYDIALVMVGGRFESNRERLRKKVQERNLCNEVTFTGWLSDRKMIQSAVIAADIGLSPFPTKSILRTNAPIKTLEYMSLGTPVVASKTPDQQEVLSASGAGLAVEHSVETFSNAIIQILDSPGVKNQMGDHGKEYISENRNFRLLTDRVEQIYRDTLDQTDS